MANYNKYLGGSYVWNRNETLDPRSRPSQDEKHGRKFSIEHSPMEKSIEDPSMRKYYQIVWENGQKGHISIDEFLRVVGESTSQPIPRDSQETKLRQEIEELKSALEAKSQIDVEDPDDQEIYKFSE